MLKKILSIGLLTFFLHVDANAIDDAIKVQRINLESGLLTLQLTPDIGGRILAVNLAGKTNFLRLGEPVISNPQPVVNADAENIGYLGHEMWVGPQSQWWTQQKVNAKRAAEKAIWPPDPFLILAKNNILEQTANKLVLQSPASPVSGLQLTKTYQLDMKEKNVVQLNVTAKNIRTEMVAWDIWFNTRAYSNTHVYVPVATEQDVVIKNIEDSTHAPLVAQVQDGLFTLNMVPITDDKIARRGKVLIQPSQGWIAGFHADQLLVIRFARQEKSVIHPEQGQVELYSEYLPNNLSEGLLEMEVHAPYKKLAPGETMRAEESWKILEYKGPNTREAQIAFLRKYARVLSISVP